MFKLLFAVIIQGQSMTFSFYTPTLEECHEFKQDCTEEEYVTMLAQMPVDVDWSTLSEFETDDSALENTKELACTAGGCEI